MERGAEAEGERVSEGENNTDNSAKTKATGKSIASRHVKGEAANMQREKGREAEA